ncbi:uncharacterized protein FIBRA_06866 [Fibroporia radiculosa]|uniref:Uncharacterized protein n=1 Tax=Fibroporia radiculosa TaxID=599839 RepID=J4GTR3_9APHY|nr:uncharacterized protein FIBRA_06866 [Fibroporia radiculosa]CCM04680.1 predicted protein [Fibroporia radiculosa]
MHITLLTIALAALCVLSAYGQTITTTNALGLTVVEEVTLDPLGLPTTEVISTLTGAVTTTKPTTTTTSPTTTSTTPTTALTTPTTSPTTTTTTTPQVVEQPAPTDGPAPATVYVYTTTNAAGGTVVLQGTFTPTFAPTTLPTPTTTGTILAYSQWLSLVGTSTVAASDAIVRWKIDRSWLGMLVGTLAGFMGGAWLALV